MPREGVVQIRKMITGAQLQAANGPIAHETFSSSLNDLFRSLDGRYVEELTITIEARVFGLPGKGHHEVSEEAGSDRCRPVDQ